MKKILSILLICIMVFSLISCGKEDTTSDTIKYDVKGISFYLPKEIEVDTAVEEGFLFNDGTQVIAIETSVKDRAKFDAFLEDIEQSKEVTDVSKCEIAGMSAVSYMTSGHPGFVLIDFNTGMSYIFAFSSYTIEDEEYYMSIMNSIEISTSKEE